MLAHIFGRALGHDQAPRITTLRPQIDQPIAGADHIQVVLDDDERMPSFEQLAQSPHELGDVVKVQTGGRLVKHEKRALARQTLAALGGTLGGLGQKARQLEALGFAARQGRHRLAQAHVFQTHIHDGLQGTDHVAVLREQGGGFAHGELQNVGHIEVAHHTADGLPLNGDLQNLRPITFAVAIRATQIHVAQKLHLNMLKARTTAGGAAAVTAVEAELAGGVTALARQWRSGKNLPDRIPRAHIAHGVGAGGFANRRLVHKHHIAQVIRPQQAVVCARGFGGFAKVAHERGGQHVLNQTRFA